jgi:hypothetical protein
VAEGLSKLNEALGRASFYSFIQESRRRVQVWDLLFSALSVTALSASCKNGLITSMGIGKMSVEFFSVAIPVRACR